MDKPKIVHIAKVAQEWDLPEAWLRRQCDAGNIPFTRIRRGIYINPAAAAEAIERLAGGGRLLTAEKGDGAA